MMKNFIKIVFVFSILCLSSNVFASNLFLSTDNNKIKNNEIFTTILNLNTEGDSINTVEGDLVYDKNLLQVEKINIGNSVINFWIEKPDNKIPGVIHFAGITPGGFVLNKGEVFSIIFRAINKGNVLLSLKNVNLLINDGKGTMSNVKTSDINVTIAKNSDNITKSVVLKDNIIPEKFSITRIKDISIYDNKYFIIFNASDKESGIEHYQVCEYWSCVNGKSPYLLRYQNNFYYIKVLAYDGNGNVRESKIVSQYLILLIFTIFLLVYFFTRRYLNINKV